MRRLVNLIGFIILVSLLVTTVNFVRPLIECNNNRGSYVIMINKNNLRRKIDNGISVLQEQLDNLRESLE